MSWESRTTLENRRSAEEFERQSRAVEHTIPSAIVRELSAITLRFSGNARVIYHFKNASSRSPLQPFVIDSVATAAKHTVVRGRTIVAI